MNAFFTLLHSDFLFAKRWIQSQPLSRGIILFGFLLVFGAVAIVLFYFSRVFFQNLQTFQVYGLLTVEYLLHAALIMVGWFTIWSAFAATATTVLTQSKERDFLLTQPISQQKIMGWLSFKTLLLNIVLFVILFLPVLLAYAAIFSSLNLISFIIVSVFVVSVVVLFSHSIGSFLGFLSAFVLQGKSYLPFLGIVLLFFLSAFSLLQVIFPRGLMRLYRAEPEEFLAIYNSLPLSSTLLPTKWLTSSFTHGFDAASIGAGFLALLVALLLYFLIRKDLVIIFQKMKEREIRSTATSRLTYAASNTFLQSRRPLLFKDWLSLRRTPSEAGYGIFLLFLLTFFLVFFYQAVQFQPDQEVNVSTLLFIFVWFMFFSTAYLLRLVFPLMAKEGETRWYLFTIPKKRTDIVNNKILLSHVLLIPHFILSVVLWILIPLPMSITLAVIVISIITLFLLTAVTIFFGFFAPEYDYAQEPEKTSTSTSGLAALLLSALTTGGGTWLVYQTVVGQLPQQSLALLAVVVIGVLTIWYSVFAKSIISRKDLYQSH